MKLRHSKKILYVWLGLLLLTPIVLWILPSDFFNNSEVIVCPSRLFFNIECFGCGMTRAVMHLHHFETDDAIYFNKGVFLVYPGLIYIWFTWVKGTYKLVKLQPLQKED
jgi:hypothetical protein